MPPGFLNADCSHEVGKRPTITGLYDTVCEISGHGSCPKELAVTGTNFLKSPNQLKCRFDDIVVKAVFLGGDALVCAMPLKAMHDMMMAAQEDQKTVTLQVTNNYDVDDEAVAEWSPPVTFTFFNSLCVVCAEGTNQVCTPNPDSCKIDGICHLVDFKILLGSRPTFPGTAAIRQHATANRLTINRKVGVTSANGQGPRQGRGLGVLDGLRHAVCCAWQSAV